MKNVIFLAPPAAGKGSFSEYLTNRLHYNHISTGELFRKRIAVQDNEGKELEQILASGKLVDDERTFRLLKDQLKSVEKDKPFILEGLPRTLDQAKTLDTILNQLNFSDYIVILINVDEDILKKRMTGRRICKSCQSIYNIYYEEFKPKQEGICNKCGSMLIQRDDDNEKSFMTRYEIFQKNNQDIINYYKENGNLYEIDNSKEDQTDALKALEKLVGVK